jgi:hypothetical protein
MADNTQQLKLYKMFKIKIVILLLLLLQSNNLLSQSAIGQLENMTGQKINRYNTNNSSNYDMNSMISGMLAQSLIKSLFNSNTKNYNVVKEVKEQPTYLVTSIYGESQSVALKLKINKYKNLMQTYKFLKDSSALKYTAFDEKKELTPEQKKASCIIAQREINKLNTMKLNFEKQLLSMEKLANDMEDYKKDFIQKKDSAMSGYVDNILDVLPIDVMEKNAKKLIREGKTFEEQAKGGKLLEEAKRLGEELSKTKRLNAAANLLMKNTDDKSIQGKRLDQIIQTNENISNTGVLIEELSSLGGNKYEVLIKGFGKNLQLQGAALKVYADIAHGGNISWDMAGKTAQNFIGIAGQFWPFVRITNAAEQLVEKTAYAAYAKFAAHQVSISLSQNAKAKEYLNNQLKEIKEKLKQYENVVNEYKKINPEGCPIE